VVPIVTGLGKFSHLLCNWDLYLAPVIARLSPIGGHNLMLMIEVVEIITGLVLAFKPKYGGYHHQFGFDSGLLRHCIP
jgi:hypothetical protein